MAEIFQPRTNEGLGDVGIESLSEYTLQAVCALEDEMFSHVPGIKPGESISAYLNDEKYRQLYPDRTDRRQFWVAKSHTTSGINVEGGIGIYEMKEDADEASYVGWFCVDPAARGQGLGRKLLQNVIETARAQGKKYVRLDTALHPKEAEAISLYQSEGFYIKKYGDKVTGPDGIECQLIDMEMKL